MDSARRRSLHCPPRVSRTGVGAFDGPTVALAMAVLAIVVLGGLMLAAWRAASLNPTDALRLE